MVTDGQVKELRRLLNTGKSLATAARMAEMDKKTARQYRDDDRLPSQRKSRRNYRTRIDPFADVWGEVQKRLEGEPKLQAKTLFGWLQDRYPGRFPDSTRRTFERRVLRWRSTLGPNKTVMFPQVHHPGQIAASDFTVMNELRVTIAGACFEHTLFHCVLTFAYDMLCDAHAPKVAVRRYLEILALAAHESQDAVQYALVVPFQAPRDIRCRVVHFHRSSPTSYWMTLTKRWSIVVTAS